MALVVVIVRMGFIRSEVLKVGKPIAQLLYLKTSTGTAILVLFSCLFSFLCQSYFPCPVSTVSYLTIWRQSPPQFFN